MQLKTILNRVEKQKGFVYSEARMTKTGQIEFTLQPRRGSKPICGNCGKKGSTYDHSTTRRFEFVPLWAIAVFFVYSMRRVDCRKCGVTTERVPWACGKNQQTYSYRIFLATWAKRLSWKETATIFGTSWDSVYRAIQWVVRWGIIHRDLSGIESIGVDEIQYRRGHNYLTLVYQLDQGAKRLLYVGKERTEESLNGFFNILDSETIAGIKYACTDMWTAYLTVLKKRASGALNILDRFHIAKKFGEALDKVRAEETRQMATDGYEEVLKNSRWSLLKRRSNLTTKQTVKLRELLKYNLRTVKAYLMREDFNRFWTYTSSTWASKFLREWCTRATRSRIEPIQKIAKMLRKHEQLLLNWFESQGLSSGVVEGFNNKAKLTMRKAYGFKDSETITTALYHQLGSLPEPKRTHRFCG
jgi:transposase